VKFQNLTNGIMYKTVMESDVQALV